ncbi:MAG: PSP1 C-terminal domain-containing protein [Isosphaeraceae bacterium]
MVEQTYLVRYGVMGHVGRFSGSADCNAPLQRGQFVVIETERGVELGEVLAMVEASVDRARRAGSEGDEFDDHDDSDRSSPRARPEVLRLAATDEIARLQPGAQERTGHFQFCQRVLQDLNWPWELIDVETLLDDHTLVLHYLGPHQLDAAPLRAWFRTAHDLDVLFEPAGTDESSQAGSLAAGGTNGHGCGASGCGHGGCGTGGDAGESSAEPSAASHMHGCGTSTHSGCSSCGIMRAMSERNQGRG